MRILHGKENAGIYLEIALKTIKVVAAVICDSLQEKNQKFATGRGCGEFKGRWELAGGKIEEGELHSRRLLGK